MRKQLHLPSSLAIGAAFVLALGSCAYDPYYTVGGSYSTGYGGYDGGYGYGSGYGYGNSGFSTSLFVSTGDPRWGYDPYCYSYYDYTRRCYYDPYLYGYYPIGYRPPFIGGVPHPRGYSRSYCPPPSRVTSVTLANYSNRESAYRNSGYSWARQVRQQPMTQPRGNSGSQQQWQQTPGNRSGPSSFGGYGNQAPSGASPRVRSGSSQYQPTAPRTSERQSGLPQRYNVPVQTAPTPESSPFQARVRPTPQMNQPRPSRQLPPMESSRPAPQPRVERIAPTPAPAVREAPSAPPPAAPSSRPAREVRGLGEGGGEGRRR